MHMYMYSGSVSPAVMKKFDHPHIIRLFGVVSHERKTYIVMELAPLGQVGHVTVT